MLNPAGTTPVLVEEGYPPVPGAAIIAEFLDETSGAELHERRLMPLETGRRVEVRRLAAWFNEKFFAEVSGPAGAGALLQAATCASSRAAARPTPTRSVRRGSMSAIIWPISAGWCAPAIGWPATSMSYRRSCRRRASVGGGLSGRCAMERRRGREELVRAGEVAPVVPPDPGRDAGRAWRRRRATPTSTSERSRPRIKAALIAAAARARLRRRRRRAARTPSPQAKRAARAVPRRRRARRHGLDGDDRRAARRSARAVAARCAPSSCSG